MKQPPPVIPPGRAFAAMATRVRALEAQADRQHWVLIATLIVALFALGMAAAAL